MLPAGFVLGTMGEDKVGREACRRMWWWVQAGPTAQGVGGDKEVGDRPAARRAAPRQPLDAGCPAWRLHDKNVWRATQCGFAVLLASAPASEPAAACCTGPATRPVQCGAVAVTKNPTVACGWRESLLPPQDVQLRAHAQGEHESSTSQRGCSMAVLHAEWRNHVGRVEKP
jgi:hypothetical protein